MKFKSTFILSFFIVLCCQFLNANQTNHLAHIPSLKSLESAKNIFTRANQPSDILLLNINGLEFHEGHTYLARSCNTICRDNCRAKTIFTFGHGNFRRCMTNCRRTRGCP